MLVNKTVSERNLFDMKAKYSYKAHAVKRNFIGTHRRLVKLIKLINKNLIKISLLWTSILYNQRMRLKNK